MKIIRYWLWLGILLFTLASCSEKKTVIQSEAEIYSHIVGNVELIFNFDSIFGKELTMNNANDRAVGVYIVDNNNQSLIVFSDGWTWGGNSEIADDINFNHGQEMKVTVVIYNSLANGFAAFIEALGPGFLEEINSLWIQDQFEEIIILQ